MLLLPLLLALAPQGIPDNFHAIHCEPPNASGSMWLELSNLVQDAEARNIKLTIQLSPPWAEMILLDPAKQADLASWQALGHELGAHHHGTDAPGVWDGYTDEEPPIGRPGYIGTMADFKTLLDSVIGGDGLQTLAMSTADYEYPFGSRFLTTGHVIPDEILSSPEFSVQNRYGTWGLTYAPLTQSFLVHTFIQEHQTAAPGEVLGAVTHVVNYQSDPTILTDWWDYLFGLDPNGLHNKTVSEILGGFPDSLQAASGSLFAGTGGSVGLSFAADSTIAGADYQILMGLSGSFPGYDYGGIYDDGVHLGVNLDHYTNLSMDYANGPYFQGFLGSLDASGGASAILDTQGPLNPSFIGMTSTLILVSWDSTGVVFSSNPVSVEIL